MGRTLNRLTSVGVNKLKAAGMHADGGGLYLRISDAGNKSWIFRFTDGGKLRDMGLGSINTVSLAAARKRAAECRELRQQGVDPITHQRASLATARASQAKSLTFKECAERYIASHESGWRSRKHHQAWTSTLRAHAYPVLGDVPARMIDTPLVMQALSPLWKDRVVTASRLRGRIEAVLDWAKVAGYRDGENPARWCGHLDHLLPKPRKVRGVEHYTALPYQDVPAFMARLRANNSMAARLIEFTILTASRLGEARGALWSEIDGDTWTAPAERMKSGREHRVPLSRAAVALLKQMREIKRGDLIFYGMRDGPVAGVTALMLAKQIAGGPVTIHGFRSSFRDWCAEQTNFPREIAEMALAHAVGSDVERAYQRGDLLERRRKLMDAWGEFCGKPSAGGKIVAIRSA
jgi:integrase